MASWSTRRKSSYFFAVAAFILLVAAGVFFAAFYKAPTCMDGKQNGNETGPDCGGACQKLCLADYASPRVLWSYSMRVVPGVYNALAYVQNPNLTVGSGLVPYDFKLYDAEGILVVEKKGSAYIPAGQKFAIFEGGLQTGSRVPTRTTFEFTGFPNWAPHTAIKGLSTVSIDVTEGDKPRAEARVQNTLVDATFGNLDAFIVLYDKDDNRVAFSKTVIDIVRPGETKSLYFTWPEAFSAPIIRSEVLFSPQS